MPLKSSFRTQQNRLSHGLMSPGGRFLSRLELYLISSISLHLFIFLVNQGQWGKLKELGGGHF